MAEYVMEKRGASRWGLILASGEGSRLRSVSERIGGAGCPKQFCRLLSQKTLYEETHDRALHLFQADHLISVVTRSHAGFYPSQLATTPSERVVIQPQGRGIATAILHALLRLQMLDPNADVALLPSDHFVSDGRRFMNFVAEGFEAIRAFPDQAVLFGIKATAPETGYGWIETETAGATGLGAATPVRRFREKPTFADAANLWRLGCLWNSFVLVARASWLLGVIQRQCPVLVRQFSELASCIGSELEEFTSERTYSRLSETDFSKDVLMGTDTRLSVIQVHGIEWSDLGDPHRLASLTNRRNVSDTSMRESLSSRPGPQTTSGLPLPMDRRSLNAAECRR